MKKYLQFLNYHHGYTEEKLLATFPEYLEELDKVIEWRRFNKRDFY
jgi:hypothetical protein